MDVVIVITVIVIARKQINDLHKYTSIFMIIGAVVASLIVG